MENTERKNKKSGGPTKNSFFKENVIPINFVDGEPFWDVGAILANIEKDIQDGILKDIIIIQRRDSEESALKLTWRGTQPMTTALGMISWANRELQKECD